MRIECAHTNIVKVGELIPHPSNRNIHSDKQIKALAKIIGRNGQRSPIVVSKLSGYITKGHGRLEAIKLLGWESCAVDYQDYADEVEELRDRIADNEIWRYAEFDKSGFFDDLKELDLKMEDLDMEEFGKIDFEVKPLDLDLGSTSDVLGEGSNEFSVTFTFEKKYKQAFDEYGKDNFQRLMLDAINLGEEIVD